MSRKNIKIFLDATGISKNNTGLGNYILFLINELAKEKQIQFTILCNYEGADRLKNINTESITILKKNIKVFGPVREIQYLFLHKIIQRHNIYHCLSSYHPFFNLPIPSITSVHDLKYLKYPKMIGNILKQFYFNITFKKGILSSSKIIAVSNHTKKDLVNIGTPKEKIKVIYEAPTINEKKILKIKLPFALFFLFVGENRPHKNLDNAIQAFLKFNRINQKRKSTGFVIVGKNTKNSVQERFDTNRDNIVCMEAVENKKLNWLYKNAIALIFPSIYEGFGLPVLEAMSFGLPVITSKNIATEEISNGSALLVDPLNPSEIAFNMHTVFNNRAVKSRCKKNGLKNSANFSWSQAAKSTLSEYKKLLINKN